MLSCAALSMQTGPDAILDVLIAGTLESAVRCETVFVTRRCSCFRCTVLEANVPQQHELQPTISISFSFF